MGLDKFGSYCTRRLKDWYKKNTYLLIFGSYLLLSIDFLDQSIYRRAYKDISQDITLQANMTQVINNTVNRLTSTKKKRKKNNFSDAWSNFGDMGFNINFALDINFIMGRRVPT